MKLLSTILLLALLAVCANAGVIVVSGNGNGWTVNNDNPTSDTGTFAPGPGTSPNGVGSFQATIGASPAGDALGMTTGVYLEWTPSGTLSLASVNDIDFTTWETSNINNESFDLALNLSNGDALFFEPKYNLGDNGNPSSVSLGTWQTWSTEDGNFYDLETATGSETGGQPTITVASYLAANQGVDISSIDVQVGYVGGFTSFNGAVASMSIQSGVCPEFADGSSCSTQTFDFENAVPEPSTWASLGGGGLLLAGFELVRRRRALKA